MSFNTIVMMSIGVFERGDEHVAAYRVMLRGKQIAAAERSFGTAEEACDYARELTRRLVIVSEGLGRA